MSDAEAALEALKAVFADEIIVNGDNSLQLRIAAGNGAPLATLSATLHADDSSAAFISLSLLDRKLRVLQPALEAAARAALSSTPDALAALMDAQAQCRQIADDARAAAGSGGEEAGTAAASAAAPPPAAAAPTTVTLLRLDHMRDTAGYSAFIVDTATGLGLAGGLYTCGRLILVVLVGRSDRAAEYLRLARTTTVDVDSAGRRCKEKMLDVLCTLTPPAASAADGESGASAATAAAPSSAAVASGAPGFGVAEMPAPELAALLQGTYGIPAPVLADLVWLAPHVQR